MPHIIVENLVKTFRVAERKPGLWGAVHRQTRTVRALDGISFGLEPGELVGYIGPNGAGRSTTGQRQSSDRLHAAPGTTEL